jgi:methylmalonyl-CoA/ethylmalonyl-CoA epimerase
MIRIEHIGIAVKDLAEGRRTVPQVVGHPSYKREAVESEGVVTSFFQVGPNKIELLESTRPTAPLRRPSRSGAKASTTLRTKWPISARRWRV